VHGLKERERERNGLLECVCVHAYLGEENNVDNYMSCLYIVLGCKTINFVEETIDAKKPYATQKMFFQRSIIIFLFLTRQNLKLVENDNDHTSLEINDSMLSGYNILDMYVFISSSLHWSTLVR
jgi:hypothetical protein